MLYINQKIQTFSRTKIPDVALSASGRVLSVTLSVAICESQISNDLNEYNIVIKRYRGYDTNNIFMGFSYEPIFLIIFLIGNEA